MKNMEKNKFPKVGEIFYWKGCDGDIHEEMCMKIEGENVDTLETMFYTYISKNGGGCFVTESDIVNPNSIEVTKFKKAKYREKINELVDMFTDETFHNMIYSALRKTFNQDTVYEIINTLSNKENYEN